MKYLTVAVPCYNSEDYMARCIDSLLPGGDAVEIIIINDGSSDRTGEIAEQYERDYPGIVRAVHQENKGHGGALNTGLQHATGKYFKVVDSDDWLDTDALQSVLAKLAQWDAWSIDVDLVICNYFYNHLHENKLRRVHYRNVFKPGELCGWDEIGNFSPSQYLIMHALIFNTAILRESGVQLPQNTFYVDNIFACKPLPFVKKMCYLDLDLYHYFIGREDQSVNEHVLCQRIDQHIRVTKIVANCVDIEAVKYPRLSTYLIRNLSIMLSIASIHLLLIGTNEAYEKRNDLWNFIKNGNPKLYKKLRFGTVSGLTYLPGKLGGLATVHGYKAAKRVYKFQ